MPASHHGVRMNTVTYKKDSQPQGICGSLASEWAQERYIRRILKIPMLCLNILNMLPSLPDHTCLDAVHWTVEQLRGSWEKAAEDFVFLLYSAGAFQSLCASVYPVQHVPDCVQYGNLRTLIYRSTWQKLALIHWAQRDSSFTCLTSLQMRSWGTSVSESWQGICYPIWFYPS